MLLFSGFRVAALSFLPGFLPHRYPRWLVFGFCVLHLLKPLSSSAQAIKTEPIEVMVVGFDHLGQLYNKQPESDVFGSKKQAELAKLRAQLARFRPEAIMLEAEPREQPRLDSLYERYQAGQLVFTALPEGRSERYQVGFVLARQLHLPAPRGVDYYAATSQTLLSTGHNISDFQRDLKLLQTTARPLRRMVQHDSLSLYDYLALANQPALVALSHRAMFNTPAMVTSGAFSATGTNTQDLGKVDTTYIGAHYITLFYNRNLKIYSNILRAQQQTQARRVLVMMGQNHVGVLEELFAANPNYRVVHSATYLKTKQKHFLKTLPLPPLPR
ncbi:MAG: DUF5694 domain-containing protein [Janthinobacterium lividum]